MSKATEFSKKEVIFTAVNSVITKLFLFFPSSITNVGKSASIILCALTIAEGIIIMLIIGSLYNIFGGMGILKITQYIFGNTVKKIYAYIISAVFLLINGLMLRSVSESINMSLMPNVDVNLISVFFIIGVCIAVYSGLKPIVRCHAVIVPVTLAAAAILFLGSIKSFDTLSIYPVFGNGAKNLWYSLLFTSFFTDFFSIMLIFPYMQKDVAPKKVIMRSAYCSSVVLFGIISAVVLAVENNTVIPVFRLAREFSLSSSSAVESVFTALWFLSFYLNMSVLLYYSCKLFTQCPQYYKTIVPFGFITFAISVLPKNIAALSRALDIMALVKLCVFFVFPIIILSAAAVKKRSAER